MAKKSKKASFGSERSKFEDTFFQERSNEKTARRQKLEKKHDKKSRRDNW